MNIFFGKDETPGSLHHLGHREAFSTKRISNPDIPRSSSTAKRPRSEIDGISQLYICPYVLE